MALGTPLVFQGCGDDDEEGREPTPATVHTVLGDGPPDLYRMGRQAVQVLGLRAGDGLSGRTVFIKPNLVAFGFGPPVLPRSGEWTKAEILAGIAEECLRAGAAKVTIGDGAQGIDWDWDSVFFFCGNTVLGGRNLKQAVRSLRNEFSRQAVELLCLNAVNEWEYIPSSSEHDMIRSGLKIARSFFEADHVISVPVLKTHTLADMSCSMKNYVGVTPSLPPYSTYREAFIRDELHRAYAHAAKAGIPNAGIAACFTDIVEWRQEAGRRDYAIVDVTIGVEDKGPTLTTGGKTIDFGKRNQLGKYALIVSDDLVAADAVCARVMGLDPGELKQLRMAKRLGLGETHRIRVAGDATLDQIRIADFVAAEQTPEWEPSATPPDCIDGAPEMPSSHALNVMGAFGLAAGSIQLYRGLHRRPGRGRSRGEGHLEGTEMKPCELREGNAREEGNPCK
jgi:uncharacterized protein (DUF362 family)